MITKPDFHEAYKFYSKEDACVEICHNSEYTYEQAVDFVKSLGLKVIDGGYIEFDSMFGDWRGYVNIEVNP